MMYIVHYMKQIVKKKFGGGKERNSHTPTSRGTQRLLFNSLFGLILLT